MNQSVQESIKHVHIVSDSAVIQVIHAAFLKKSLLDSFYMNKHYLLLKTHLEISSCIWFLIKELESSHHILQRPKWWAHFLHLSIFFFWFDWLILMIMNNSRRIDHPSRIILCLEIRELRSLYVHIHIVVLLLFFRGFINFLQFNGIIFWQMYLTHRWDLNRYYHSRFEWTWE